MKVVEMLLSEIKPYEKNPKGHKMEWIVSSIKQFKPDQPIVVDKNHVIIKGHGRYEAAKILGMETFPVIVRADLSEEEIRLSRIADNRSSEGGWDFELLKGELESLYSDAPDFSFSDFGLSPNWLSELAAPVDNADHQKEWVDILDFDNKDMSGYRKITVHFEDEEGVKMFKEKLGVELPDTATYLYYPKPRERRYVGKRAYK